jgi:hypothetical protein
MQLREVALYNARGDVRLVPFRLGALNVVTGESQTGKSALLTIIEYCLGRDHLLVPIGPITDTVVWYGALWDLGGNARAFVARPAPADGKASTQQAMLEFGGPELEPLPFDRLEVNTDSTSLREQLGRRIGIEENLQLPAAGSLRQPLEANLGHAALLCLQGQSEIANPNQLFHRQGERGLDDALRDTIPYFLGAVPRDQALKRAQLRDAKRALARAVAAVRAAELTAGTIDVQLTALLAEARAVGLTDALQPESRAEMITVLTAARHAPPPAEPALPDVAAQDRRRALQDERDAALATLQRILDERALLLDQRSGERDYVDALALQAGRLTSLQLLDIDGDDMPQPDMDSGGASPSSEALGEPSGSCPACGHTLTEADATPMQLRGHLEHLQAQLQDLSTARPAQRDALERLEGAAAEARDRLAAAEAALSGMAAGSAVTAPTTGGNRDFTRGRIDAVLSRTAAAEDTELQRLRLAEERAAATVQMLEAELSDDDAREQLTSRLLAVGRDMTAYADLLQLEHRGPSVRIDLAKLTVVTDIESGPAPLFRIGSAENWIGYHLITHLALHRHFVRQNRPVPRLLVLDQPTQAYYPSEVTRSSGVAANDADRRAVRRLFELMRDVVADLAPELQVIVCDHANLPEEWFQDAVAHDWRGGHKLIPPDWLVPDGG